MLSELRVRQLGVVEDVTVQLGSGMTALTGETGAGKTLIVEALQLALGQRADPRLVRTGESEALIEARFTTEDDEEGETVIARAIPANGRSRCWIDGRMAPLSSLVDRCTELADIHGQGDHQALLHTAAQRRALDVFGQINPRPVEVLRQRLATLKRRLGDLGGDRHERARDQDILGHQIREIEEAALDDPDEEVALFSEAERLSNMAALRQSAIAALGAFDLEGSDGGVLELLGRADGSLDGHAAFGDLGQRIRSLQAEAADIASELRSVVENWEENPERLQAVQERRRHLTDLYRKYGGSWGGTVAFAKEARERLQRLERADVEANELEVERHHVETELRTAEASLLAARREAAPLLARAVELRLGDLAMGGATFGVEVEPVAAGETVTFLLAANAGEALRPLAKAASGGELARTMLALRLVAPGGPPTMVFDEVDAGVGGTAALALARALHEVARDRQVLVVTHLAQVAAFADRHIAIRKTEEAGRAVTSAQSVEGSDRVEELSRMLSGHPHSARARAHAEELLDLAASKKQQEPSRDTPPSARRPSIRV